EQYDINDPLWLRRFEPDKGLYAKIKEFDNTICSGPRGCGKTIYLRSLSFVPRLIKLINYNPEKYSEERKKIAFFDNMFGIYFACRQGEFKYFSKTQFDFENPKTPLFIKHIIILRIIKSTLKLIHNAYNEELFNSEPKIKKILKFLKNYLLGEKIILIKEEHKNPLGQLVEIIGEEENYCEKLLDDKRYPDTGKMLNEHRLIKFFNILKESIHEIRNMKFYIIFDDISEPQVPIECQKIINSLMACLNETYCCKFSTEKFAYTYVDMYGKTLQSTNDYTYIDLSVIGGFEDRYTEREYKNYLERIINRRLNISKFKRKINEILENLPYPTQTLINLLSEYARGNTALRNEIKFAGWDLIVQLSSRSVRDAIAICDFIFREYESLKGDLDNLKKSNEKISVDIQNRAIKKYSIQEYKGLVNISYHGKEVFNIVRNFGEISRHFLKREITKEKGRKYEVITIERTDVRELSENAEKILRTLIRYSVFLDRGLSFSREQIGLVEKLTLHKKFTPALMTTYREREHLRLSKNRLEKFILKPDEFREELLTGRVPDKHQLELFDFPEGDKIE
ncbi:MAG: ORC-CDC6 family AAA ATPase, partial [Promethearchaeota archaeon]